MIVVKNVHRVILNYLQLFQYALDVISLGVLHQVLIKKKFNLNNEVVRLSFFLPHFFPSFHLSSLFLIMHCNVSLF